MSELSFKKLPKTCEVLSLFLHHLEDTNPSKIKKNSNKPLAAKLTCGGVKTVWSYHFGPDLIFGGDESDRERLICNDHYIIAKVLDTFKEWKQHEKWSNDRIKAGQTWFKNKEDTLKEKLDLPFNISKKDCEKILMKSGIIDWTEDLAHLKNQLQKEQPGCCHSFDLRQEKKDERRIREKLAREERERKERERNVGVEASSDIALDQDEHFQDPIEETNDDFSVNIGQQRTGEKNKIDVMGNIATCADRLGLSYRDRTLIAASVAKSLGVDIDKTNINPYSAWKRAREERERKAEEIKESFTVPKTCCVHWDGKTLKVETNLYILCCQSSSKNQKKD